MDAGLTPIDRRYESIDFGDETAEELAAATPPERTSTAAAEASAAGSNLPSCILALPSGAGAGGDNDA